MRQVFTIFYREFKSYFQSPIAYIFIIGFLVISGLLFGLNLLASQEASLRYFLGNTIFVLIFIIPALTMRLFSEEKKTGTLEILMTLPVRDYHVLFGKFFSAVAFYILMLLLTFSFPLTITILGSPDFGVMFVNYLGLLLFGMSLISIGLYASLLTENQIVAFMITLGTILFLFFFHALSNILGESFQKVFEYISLNTHFENFGKGLIDTSDVIYYLSIIVLFLFLSLNSLESRKWK
jgi:ABC-2 type transport system permease protein